MYKLWFVAAVVALVASGYIKQPSAPTRHKVPSLLEETWSASDKPYKDAEAQMAWEYAAGKTPQAILEEYRTVALQRPADPVAQFSWVNAEKGEILVSDSQRNIPDSLVKRLEGADPGNVHEFARCRYCMSQEAGLQPSLQWVIAVGEKLLHYDPKDQWVRTNMIYFLLNTKAGFQQALSRALYWVKLEPNNSKAHSTLALVYEDIWAADRKHHRSEAAKSVEEYRTYLRLAPTRDPFRQNAQYLVKTITQQAALNKG